MPVLEMEFIDKTLQQLARGLHRYNASCELNESYQIHMGEPIWRLMYKGMSINQLGTGGSVMEHPYTLVTISFPLIPPHHWSPFITHAKSTLTKFTHFIDKSSHISHVACRMTSTFWMISYLYNNQAVHLPCDEETCIKKLYQKWDLNGQVKRQVFSH